MIIINALDLVTSDGDSILGTDILFEHPCCRSHRDNGTYDWSVLLCKLKNDPTSVTARHIRSIMWSTRSIVAVISMP